MKSQEDPSQFYTGLIADLYEPLAAHRPEAAPYIPFLERSGTPALELACGSGLPLVELVKLGFEVDGLDSSQDMLDRCNARAAESGVEVSVHLGMMQQYDLPRRYRSIFLAGASFTLLTSDEDAARALETAYAHLEPGGGVLIPLELPDVPALRKGLGYVREVENDAGDALRFSLVELDVSADGQSQSKTLRYERVPPTGEPEVVERAFRTRYWSQEQFGEMLAAAGFGKPAFVAPEGGRAEPDAETFVALARRPED